MDFKPLIDVIEERLRQVREKGYNEGHDDCHKDNALSLAAAAMAAPCSVYTYSSCGPSHSFKPVHPWGKDRRYRERRSELVKAAALILAEIERGDRLNTPVKEKSKVSPTHVHTLDVPHIRSVKFSLLDGHVSVWFVGTRTEQ